MDEITILTDRTGTGKEAQFGSKVNFHCCIMLEDWKVVRDSKEDNELFQYTIGDGRMIEGLENAIVGMREGGVRTVRVPAKLAYGSEAVPGIPPFSNLLLTIELIKTT